MHRVRLRDYLSRIERLINENRLPEAVSHCHHVLRQYPLHIDTYRLYGRVLLEQQQYTEAIDIFERVASVDPEDLIAHAGLALAYKENLNLPRAVWHMERAFEIDPYNRAIRDELAELYAARDGYTRDQIDLTRPALARLYFHNSLYREAAAELSFLLRKQPHRLDLKMLLADTLFWADRRADLIDVCLSIVESMPYSVKANAILAAEWMRNNRPTEANEHWRRVQALTLLTAGSVDPDSTLGRASLESEDLSFPKEIGIEQLDDVSAATPLTDRIEDWSSESDVIEGDEQMPGWLQEIGFEPMEEMPAGDILAEPIIEPDDVDDQSLDIDWEELALSVDVAGEQVEHLEPDEAADDPMVADLLAMVDDVETTAHDQMLMESLEALTELDEAPAEETIVDEFSSEDLPEMSLDDQTAEPLEFDSVTEPQLATSFDEEADDWSESLDDLSELVEELEDQRKGMTTILPPLESVETRQEKDPDWMDDLAGSSDVDEVLPDWLYETVGFTDDITEDMAEETATDYQGVDEQLSGIPAGDKPDSTIDANELIDEDRSEFQLTEEAASDSEPGEAISQDFGLLSDEESDSDSDIPDWLLDADDVLDELPEEILESSDDSWLEELKDDEEATSWLDEIEAEPLPPAEETTALSGEGLTGFLSRGLGMDASADASEESESEPVSEDEPVTPDDEDAE